MKVGLRSSFLPCGGVLKRREIVLVGVVLLVMFLMGVVVELVGIGICDARERSEANHFCLVPDPGLDVVLFTWGIVLVVVSRSYRPFVVSMTERTVPIDRPYDEKAIELWDGDLLILDLGDTFSPPGQAEQLALAIGRVGVEDISAVDLSIEVDSLEMAYTRGMICPGYTMDG